MKWLLLLLFLLIVLFRLWLRKLNLRNLARHGHEIPAGFESSIDQATLAKASDYTVATSRIALVEALLGSLVLALFLFAGLIDGYDGWTRCLTDSFVGQGVVFVIGLFLAQTVLDIPFSLYRTFVLEERFEFNRSTPWLWVTDLFKSFIIGAVLLALLTTGALALVQASPDWWWLWVWGFFAVVTLTLMYLSPVLIEPLFFTFEPLQDEELSERVRSVMAQAGLQIERVQQVDASRRSGHSNAYFTGIGRVKRIVLFDTLLDQMTDEEILAVLAHEAGHWRLGHIWKRLLGMEMISLAACWLAWWLLRVGDLSGLFGYDALSLTGEVLLLGFLASLVFFPLTPLFSAFSRRCEWQADGFAEALLQKPSALASALVKLSCKNLSNLHPHPFYAWFYYSHPPVIERVGRLNRAAIED